MQYHVNKTKHTVQSNKPNQPNTPDTVEASEVKFLTLRENIGDTVTKLLELSNKLLLLASICG